MLRELSLLVLESSCHARPDDPLAAAESSTQRAKVRRLPIADAQGRLIGILSLNDLARQALRDRTPKTDPRFYLAASAAEFAELLRESEHAKGGSLARVQEVLEQVVPRLPLDEKAAELLDLVKKAQGLQRAP